MAYKINLANIKDWAKNYDGPLFDGILCDPPYELGFMGKSWDSSGIAFDVEMWQNIYKLLKPGAHLLAFSGSRTYHRMAVAIEDAGFEIRDMIEWVYGSGFPKSLNIGKAVDKIQGNEREDLGWQSTHINRPKTENWDKSAQAMNHGKFKVEGKQGGGLQHITKGTSEWEGYGTALKPAHEPCVLARKPIEGNVAQNCLKHGVGGLNIDGSRVGVGADKTKAPTKRNNSASWFTTSDKTNLGGNDYVGRFPANLIHDGSDEVLEVFPDSKSTGGTGKITLDSNTNLGGGNNYFNFGDSGSASRFFYCAKSSKSERNAGLDGFEIKEALFNNTGLKNNGDGTERPQGKFQNHHPTVKPLALTKYLANLIKPPKGGRLLVPFSGSGSEMIGALQAGWEYVEGVELTEEYIPIAEARIKYWLEQMDKEQPSLFNV